MTHRQKKQYNRGCDDCARGVEHKEGRGKFYDMAYADDYAREQRFTECIMGTVKEWFE